MTGSFSGIISASIQWTKTLLFKPFNAKKWISMLFIALFAFQIQGGCNLNLNLKDAGGRFNMSRQQLREQFNNIKANIEYRLSWGDPKQRQTTIILLALIAALIIALVLITQWFYAVFSFAYIDAIVSNEYKFGELFRRNKALGASYFLWNVGITSVLIIFGYALWTLGYRTFYRFSSGVAALVFLGIFLAVVGGFFAILINDYALIVMFKKKVSIIKALPIAANALSSDVIAFVKYIFLKFILSIVAGIIGGILSAVAALTLTMPIIIIVGVFALLFKMAPATLRLVLAGVSVAFSIPVLMVFIILVKSVLLPFSIFLKTFNIKFIARLNKEYDLFSLRA